jgi:ubiquinone/menaquinone biosynthesis C-methylase UbiE
MKEVRENKGYVSAKYLKKAAQDLQQFKARSIQLMQIKADSQVLDVGCGPAIDTIAFSELVGDRGRIVGVDSDPEMVQKANHELKKLNITKNVKHRLCSAQTLPFANSEFDCVHSERLFQVLPVSLMKPIFSEMNRVLKSKGRIILVDTDWASASVDFSDFELERRLIGYFGAKMRPNGFAGRQLLGLLKNGGYEDVTVEIFTNVLRDFKQTPFSDWLTKEALKNKVATQKEIEKWNTELTQKTRQGAFLSIASMILVAGSKK